MADLWVPFVAAFVAAAALLVARQALVAWTRRSSWRAPRRRSVEPALPFSREMLSARLARNAPVRNGAGRNDSVGDATARNASAGSAIARGGDDRPEPVQRQPIIIGAPGRPIIIGGPSDATPAPAMAAAATQMARPERIAPMDVPLGTDEDEMARRLRVAVGPGRPSTTVGTDTAVWSQWTQDVASPEVVRPEISSPDAAPLASNLSGGDEDCPHCAGARQRGARFCGRCGRQVADPVAAPG